MAPFRVGEFLVEPQLNTVAGNNKTTRIEPKVMQVLVCLAERAGEVVPKARIIQSVWTDTFVTDDVLTRAISELRKVFSDEAKEPRFIQTIPRGGYRLIAPLVYEGAEQKVEETASVGGAPAHLDRRARPYIWWSAGAGFGMILLMLLAISLWRTVPTPKLSDPVPITDDGQQKTALVTDGSRLYIAERVDNKPALFQVSVTGGETIPFAVPFHGLALMIFRRMALNSSLPATTGPIPFLIGSSLCRAGHHDA